jgi:hypothetical protein
MADPSALEILQVPGYLYWEPTSVPGSETTWGTKLGYLDKGVDVTIHTDMEDLFLEEYGDERIGRLYRGTNATLYCELLNYNATTLGRLFPGLSGTTYVQAPNGLLPGARMDATAYVGRLLFVPKDTTNNPVFLMQKVSCHHVGTFSFTRSGLTMFALYCDSFRKTGDVQGIYYLGPLTGAVLR